MSPSPTDAEWLRLDPPFFLPAILKEAGLKSEGLAVVSFADDLIASAVNAALRKSLEQLIEQGEFRL